MKKRTLFGLLPMLIIGTLTLGTALAASGNLPGGTPIEVTIDDPVSSTEFFIPAGGTTVDVDVLGTASIGQGAVIKDTSVIYVMDISGSMGANAGVDCNGDAVSDSRLVCEKEAVKAANTAAADPQSSVDETGLASFATSGTAHDVDLGSGGTQYIVAPNYDGNSNSAPDVQDVAYGLSAGGMTCYHCGLSQALTILGFSTNPINIVIFMSDGANNTGPHVNTLAGNFGTGTTIHSFAMGSGVNCTSDPAGKGSLNDVAALTPGGTCTQVTDISKLADLITKAVGSTLDSLEIEVNSTGPSPIDNADIDPDLPQSGPANVSYDTTVYGLGPGDHELCINAYGKDAGGSGSVQECVTIHVIQEIAIDIKPGSCPNPLNVKSKGVLPVAILGTSDFDVTHVDPASVLLEGVSPLRWNLEDVATPFEPYTGKTDAYDCNEYGPDGHLDLTLKFDSQEIVAALGDINDGDVLALQLTGYLKQEYNGTPIAGQDIIVILKK